VDGMLYRRNSSLMGVYLTKFKRKIAINNSNIDAMYRVSTFLIFL
jgi:hypothetical protein